MFFPRRLPLSTIFLLVIAIDAFAQSSAPPEQAAALAPKVEAETKSPAAGSTTHLIAKDASGAPLDGRWLCSLGEVVKTKPALTYTLRVPAEAVPGTTIRCWFTGAGVEKQEIELTVAPALAVRAEPPFVTPGGHAMLIASNRGGAASGEWSCGEAPVTVTTAKGMSAVQQVDVPATATLGSKIACTFAYDEGGAAHLDLPVAAAFTVRASKATVAPGTSVTLTVTSSADSATAVDGKWACTPPAAGSVVAAKDKKSWLFTAADEAPDGTDVQCTFTDTAGQKGTVALKIETSPWEYRSVLGWEQSAASAAASKSAYFFDFFIMRALSNQDAGKARFNVWGNIRLATAPIQTNPSLTDFVKNAAAAPGTVTANQLVQGAEFTTGVELHVHTWENARRVRALGAIAGFGASGPYNPHQTVTLLAMPTPGATPAPQVVQLFSDSARVTALQAQGFSLSNPPTTLALTVLDREQFYKRVQFGGRIETFDKRQPQNPPGTYAVTFGWDQAITGGRFQKMVANFDVFFPLPLDIGQGFHFVYLFATAAMRLGSTTPTPPMFLDPAGANVSVTAAGTAVLTTTSQRDVYRIGVGFDLLSALKLMKVTSNNGQ